MEQQFVDEPVAQAILSDDPGNPIFASYAEYLRRVNRQEEALRVCLAGLSVNPSFDRGRLTLARIFYDQQYLPFAARELELLYRRNPASVSLRKLVDELLPGAQPLRTGQVEAAEETVAEAEIDLDAIELLDSEELDQEKD